MANRLKSACRCVNQVVLILPSPLQLKASSKMDAAFSQDKIDRNSPQPLYLQVYDVLRKYALSAEVGKAEILPSTEKLSKLFGVSQNTIRQAMRLLVDGNLVCRVRHRGTMLTSGQLPDDPQANLRSIALIFPSEGYDFWQPLLKSMHREAEANGYYLDIYLYKWTDLAAERRALTKAFRNCSGVILYPNANGDDRELIEEFNAMRQPLVLFLLYFEDLDASVIAADNQRGAYTLTRCLIHGGAKRIAFVHNLLHLNTPKLRLEGYRKALKEYGLEAPAELVGDGTCLGNDFEKWMKRTTPDAIVCDSPGLARKAACYLKSPNAVAFFASKREKMPEGMIIAYIPSEALGQAAIEELLHRLRNSQFPKRKIQINLSIEPLISTEMNEKLG
jgi:DNA-binding LacI/PurR family transcriptional regulator